MRYSNIGRSTKSTKSTKRNPCNRMRYVNKDDDDGDDNNDEESETIVVRRGDRFIVVEDFSVYSYDIPGSRARHRISGTIEFLEEDQLVFNGIVNNKFYEFLFYPKLSKKRAAEFKFVIKNIDTMMGHLYPLDDQSSDDQSSDDD